MTSEWKIGEMAALLETTAKTLRHYESLGLLPPPVRTASGYRLYDALALQRATLVLGLRRIGLSIAEVSRVVEASPDLPGIKRRLAQVLDDKLRETDEQLGILQGRREDLAAREQRLFLSSEERCLCGWLSMACHCGRAGPPTP